MCKWTMLINIMYWSTWDFIYMNKIFLKFHVAVVVIICPICMNRIVKSTMNKIHVHTSS